MTASNSFARETTDLQSVLATMGEKFKVAVRRWPWLLSIVAIFLLWQLVGMTGQYRFLPSLGEIAAAGVRLIEEDLLIEARRTAQYFAIGMALAVVLGVLVGALMGRYQSVEYFCDIYINTFMAAPVSALVPILIVLFGLGQATIVATVFMFAFFVIVVNTFTGVRETSASLIEMARSFGASETQIVRRIVLPNAIPLIITGLRMAVARGVNGVILGEMLISVVGVGGLLMFYGGAFRIPELYALIFLVVGFSLTLIAVLQLLESWIAPWR